MSLVNPKQYIISARSNGYKDTAYAIAELADNSIQAGADKVEILIFENQKRTIEEIAIVDNGAGMSQSLLASALGFGESGREKDKDGNLLNDDTKGMGKFGMGLPNASVSQCKRIQVWSWKNKHEVYYTYLDVQEIIDGIYSDLPEPTLVEMPEKYLDSMFDGDMPESGTFVLWSNLDKLKWKRSSTLFAKSQYEIGRMYRRFISKGQCSVQFKVFDTFGGSKMQALERETKTGFIKANDPLYLIADSALPELPGLHIDEEPTFFEELENFKFQVEFQKARHTICIRSSVAREEIIKRILQSSPENKAGNTIYGKNCERNFGLSVMRADREIELISNEFFLKDDATKTRFMGVEIDIPPSLDEVLGVTNNKQHAHNLKELIAEKMDIDDESVLDNEGAIIEYLRNNNDEERAVLFEISSKLKKAINNARKRARALTTTRTKSESENLTEDDKVSLTVNSVMNKRDEISPGNTLSQKPNYQELEKKLVDDFGYNETNAKLTAKKMEDLQSRISVQYSKTSNQSFFEVENLQGIAVLIINPEHELYTKFLSQMSDKDKMIFKVLLGAWAVMEDSTTNENKRRQLERARNDWGEVIEEMFEELDL
ncbi:ATP-binding protein [Pseudoalteromonas sp. SWXJ133]|uniref:ATP-binding protein n=1 Tax=Pseudoalteromonas sp. SWXJ133 TaxID=2792069 RepID=UPI0018CCB636|nr:ATP-binding protein [Pseudoalteromonas sp. SWXJ133]MBH0019872.1 ATP-binding protein [Pseudoalteromonas sp. SWXJ133]